MKFADDKELEQFVDIAVKIKAMKRAGVPIPADVKEYFEQNKDKNDVCYVLNDMIKH